MKPDKKTLYSLLGKLPDRNHPIKVQLISREETNDLIIERLMLDLNGIEQIPAYFTKPKNSSGKIPGGHWNRRGLPVTPSQAPQAR